jgi:eukaryotic-like serine/threonine-protein kinase
MITHDRWQRIKEIFDAALDRPPAERPAFLTRVCGTDAAMREKVEALLTADAGNEDFLIETAYEFAEGMLANEPSEFSAGQEVGQYKIEYFLSSGGMGQIYGAHDTKLGRKIALKFISPEYAKDRLRVKRFEQEARAASALNHPNVCVIHEVGVTDNDRHFIAMEFIQGTTLRDELARRSFRPLEALEIIIQVGNALASAHAKGIVHRDIKPENIMLRHDGYVKVVDFGLAKLTELLPERDGSEAETKIHTEAHMIMGTVRYMSPEQLRESPVDERTDIWSLGTVLYEMLTGATPFTARAPNDSIALILTAQPQFSEQIPVPLREIIKKTLEKDCAHRYQTITKLTADLTKLKWELEHNEEDYIAPVPALQPAPLNHSSSFLTRLKSQAVLTADSLFGEIRTYKTATLFTASFVFILLLVFLLSSSGPHPSPFQNMSMEPLTDAGTTVCAAISPDGTWVAHAEQQNGKQLLTLTNTTVANTFVAVPADDVKYLGVSFTPDSKFLFFTRTEKNNDGILYLLALSSFNSIKLKEGVDSPISFSPQGDRFAFVRYDEATTEYSLVLSDNKIDGMNEQIIARRRNGDTLSLYGVAWSPDGRTVICPEGDWKKSWQMNLVAFDLEKGRERVIGNQSWFSMQQIAWYPDMTGLVVSATLRQTAPHQLWWISFPDGTVQKITRDLYEYSSVGLAGKKLATVQANRQWRIWVVPLDDVEKATSIASGVGLYFGLNWTSRGKIVYSAMAQERLNLFQVDPVDRQQGQLTANAGDNFMPASSLDGRFIVFASNRDGSFNIWRMNADDGSDPTQLTFSDGNFYPSVSPDNQWTAYDNLVKSSTSIFKVPLAGGEPVKVGDNYRMPVFSPDNQFIAGRYDEVSGSRDVAIFPAQGGQPLRHFTVPVQDWQSVQWLPNREVSYVKNVDGYSNIYTYNLDTGTEKQITRFNTDQIYAYAWSPDYKQIACLRGNKFPNVTIMR